jgi:thiamine biosynthesis lipoprotein
LVNLSERIHVESEGFFDIGLGRSTQFAGFGPKDAYYPENPYNPINRPSVDFKNHQIIRPFGFYFDMSAIAKGFAVDQVALLLEAQGVFSYMVEIGGEIRVGQPKPDVQTQDALWRLAIEKPQIQLGKREVFQLVHLQQAAMATSGNYRNFKANTDAESTLSSSHIYSVEDQSQVPGVDTLSGLVSVTVIAKDCATADAWATALMAGGLEKAQNLAEKNHLAAYFIYYEDKDLQSASSTQMREWIKPAAQ